MDSQTREQRSANMSLIRGKDTRPEMLVRRMLHSSGYRYRLHDRRLPGTPDLVFRSRRKAVFVNGCFWHMHTCRRGQSEPKTNSAFWREKRLRTARRDEERRSQLEALGWEAYVVWECELKDPSAVLASLKKFLDRSSRSLGGHSHRASSTMMMQCRRPPS